MSVTGLTETIQRLDDYEKGQDDFSEQIRLVLEKTARLGVSVAWQVYTSGNLDGNYDIDVDWQFTGDKSACVIARGTQVLFLEFGTGITYASAYPTDEGFKPIFKAGDYSKDHKKQWDNPKGWYYTDNTGKTSNHTYGIPAARGMYEAKKKMQDEVKAIVREVFG